MKTKLNRNYWKLWIASVTSNLGDGISTIAYPWLASAITRDGFKLGLVVLATRLPWLVFSLPHPCAHLRITGSVAPWLPMGDSVRF